MVLEGSSADKDDAVELRDDDFCGDDDGEDDESDPPRGFL